MSCSNRIKRELSMDNLVLGCMVSEMRSPAIGMILERAGLDFFIIDMEHGSFNYETAADILVASRGLDIVPFVRVPAIDREPFQKMLDAGARGLLVPRVETTAQVHAALDFMHYPPAGSRGLSLRRGHSGFGRPDPVEFTAHANESIMLMVQIETRRGVEDIDAICEVTGIDVLFVGPSDLNRSYGDVDPEDVQRAVRRVIEVGTARKIATGIHTSDVGYINRLVGEGMRFISINTEVGAIISTFSQTGAAIRSAAGQRTEG
ncbi:MAG: HpcH/HpaI aldolase family protein [Chloroflexota bacterium]